MGFERAKIALYLGDRLVVILRDDFAGLPFPGYWDLPGGGREGAETPVECVQRECLEELGLAVPKAAIVWQRSFVKDGITNWYFVGRLPTDAISRIIFGNEGQRWALMTDAEFLSHPKAVPMFQDRLKLYLTESSGGERPPAL